MESLKTKTMTLPINSETGTYREADELGDQQNKTTNNRTFVIAVKPTIDIIGTNLLWPYTPSSN